MGYVNYHSTYKIAHLGLLPKLVLIKTHKCEICVESKFARNPFKSIERSSELLELVHSDLCDLKMTLTRGGRKYFITFIDDYSIFCYVYLLHSKDETTDVFKTYKNEVENQKNKTLKMLRSDRGKEYESTTLSEFCALHGIVHQTIAPYTPQQNNIVERKNRTLKDMVHSMLNSSGLQQYMWGETLLTTNTILNTIPHKKTSKSSYELWKGKLPSYKRLKMWGCLAKVQVLLPKRIKLRPKTIDCVFIGYASNGSAYRFLVIKFKVPDTNNNIIMESIDAEFFEEIFPFKERHNEIIKRKIDDSLPRT